MNVKATGQVWRPLWCLRCEVMSHGLMQGGTETEGVDSGGETVEEDLQLVPIAALFKKGKCSPQGQNDYFLWQDCESVRCVR